MNENVLQHYVELRKQIFRLEEELAEIKPAAIEALRMRDRRVVFDDFELSLQVYRYWQYSSRVELLQSELNETKKQEREDGTARIRDRRDTIVMRQRAAQQVREDAVTYVEVDEETELEEV